MAFWGNTFVYDGIPGEMYDLYISSPDGGDVEINAGNDVSLYTQEIFRRPKPYFYGVQQTPVLEFDISFNTPTELTAIDAHLAEKWLFGKQGYKKLQIMQNDLEDMYFNCFLTAPKAKKTGNIVRGFIATVICDAPWGWTFPRTMTRTYTDAIVNEQIIFNNTSDDNFYNRPMIAFTMNNLGGDFSITNVSDNNRVFSFSDLAQSESITVNNDLCTINSVIGGVPSGLLRLEDFNKQFFRLIPGKNVLNISGNISSFSMTYQFARKV